MGYHHVRVAALETAPARPSMKCSISDACGLNNLAADTYEVAPGEAIPLAYHYHDEQEEMFYLTADELHVETLDKEYVVPADDAFICDPESPQFAAVPKDGTATIVLIVGASAVNDVHPYKAS
jgi:uncharacterized cupin superfamily protein